MTNHNSRRDMTAAVAAMVALVVAAAPLDGQEDFRFRSGVDLVNVTATVTDSSGRLL
jgi:hypothetical protein